MRQPVRVVLADDARPVPAGHVQNVLVKLGVHSKLEAAALAVRPGAGQHRGPPGLGAPHP